MKALKLNITKMLTQAEKDRVFHYSSLLAECYNLCLEQLKADSDFKKVHPISKEFQHQHKEIYSKHAQNIGRDAINAAKSFYAKKKKDKTTKYPKNFRKYSVITLDANIQVRNDKQGNKVVYFGGGFKLYDYKLQISYPQISLDFSNSTYFKPIEINKDAIKQILIKIDKEMKIWIIFIYAEQKQLKPSLNKEFISIDLGIASVASVYSSKGECFKYKTRRFKGLEKAKDELKSKRDRHKKGSKHWLKLQKKVQKKQRKISNKRIDYLHKASKHIVNYCFHNQIDNIICGDIQTKKLKTDKEQMKELNFKERRAVHSRNKSTQNEGLLSRFKRLH